MGAVTAHVVGASCTIGEINGVYGLSAIEGDGRSDLSIGVGPRIEKILWKFWSEFHLPRIDFRTEKSVVRDEYIDRIMRHSQPRL